jgi:hypothetical protein
MAEETLEQDAGDEGEPKVEGTTTLTAEDTVEKDSEAKASEEDAEGQEASGENADHGTDEKPKDGAADDGKDGVPKEYEAFALPEGVEMDTDMAEKISPLFKELGMTQDNAQRLVDFYADGVARVHNASIQAWADQQAEWQQASENDPEYGKGKYDASLVIAKSAVRELGGTALMKAIEETQMGSHPEVIRAFWKIGLAMKEDGVEIGKAAGGRELTAAERIFPNQAKSA